MGELFLPPGLQTITLTKGQNGVCDGSFAKMRAVIEAVRRLDPADPAGDRNISSWFDLNDLVFAVKIGVDQPKPGDQYINNRIDKVLTMADEHFDAVMAGGEVITSEPFPEIPAAPAQQPAPQAGGQWGSMNNGTKQEVIPPQAPPPPNIPAQHGEMILRPRQKTFVANCLAAISEHGNTLGVANTGFGKTVALSAITAEQINGTGRALVLQHRDELTRQNSAAFIKVAPEIPISLYTASNKSWRGRVTFGMVQTMANAVDSMPRLDLLVVDEAHHAASASYQKVIGKAREVNPRGKILGVTATPERSDRKGLANVFTNVADVVTIPEMVQAGHLVPPRAMVVDIGTQSTLRMVKRSAGDYDQAEVEAIQNTTINNNQIVEHWLQASSDRPTVAFCRLFNMLSMCEMYSAR